MLEKKSLLVIIILGFVIIQGFADSYNIAPIINEINNDVDLKIYLLTEGSIKPYLAVNYEFYNQSSSYNLDYFDDYCLYNFFKEETNFDPNNLLIVNYSLLFFKFHVGLTKGIYNQITIEFLDFNFKFTFDLQSTTYHTEDLLSYFPNNQIPHSRFSITKII